MSIQDQDSINVDLSDGLLIYCRTRDNDLETVVVDLSFHAQIPLSEKPSLLVFEIGIVDARNKQPADNETLLKICSSFESLVTQVESGVLSGVKKLFSNPKPSIELKFTGRITRVRSNVRTTYYYFNGSPIPDGVLERLGDLYPNHNTKINVYTDPNAKWYLDYLYPGPALKPLIVNIALLELRNDMSDDSTVERPVDHTLYFPSESARGGFLQFTKDSAWAVSTFEQEGSGDEKFGVVVTKSHQVDKTSCDMHVIALAGRAEKFGGRYDGWGAPIVPKKK